MRTKACGLALTRHCSGRVAGMKALLPVGMMLIAAIAMVQPAFSDEQPVGDKPEDAAFSFPAPGPSPQGIAWDGKHLWIVDDGTDMVYELDPADGKVLSSFASPGGSARGIVWDGRHLWTSDDASRKIYKLAAATGRSRAAIAAPVMSTERGPSPLGGLAWDGQCLWSGWIAGWSSRMNRVDPTDGSVKKSYFSKGYPRALTSDGEFLWSATDNGGHRLGIIYKYDLSNGLCVSQCDAPGYYPVGLAFDGQHLWCVDQKTKRVYRLAAK